MEKYNNEYERLLSVAKNTGNLYEYKATCFGVYDGDSVDLNIHHEIQADIGFDILMKYQVDHKIKVRLLGINAPEMTTPQGKVSRDALRMKILNKPVMALTVKDKKEKFGRYLAVIYVNGENVNEWLVREGFAKFQTY